MNNLPLAVGFGIKTAEQVRTVNLFADAAVVGSALVDQIKANLDDGTQSILDLCESVIECVQVLASGTARTRSRHEPGIYRLFAVEVRQ